MVVENIMFFMIEDDSVLLNYNEIWNKVKEYKTIKFHINPFDDPHVYIEECKYKIKKKNMIRLIDVELFILIIDSGTDSE